MEKEESIWNGKRKKKINSRGEERRSLYRIASLNFFFFFGLVFAFGEASVEEFGIISFYGR